MLEPGRLWPVQRDAITNLERSLAANRPRALIQMATGSGKTYTACSFCYRLIKFGKAKRILFLVDRNNLARQTLNEFQQFVSPQTNDSFANEYVVQHLRGNAIDPASKVVITTIQRLYGALPGAQAPDTPRGLDDRAVGSAVKEGMLTLRMDGMVKIKKGVTTLEEVVKETAG